MLVKWREGLAGLPRGNRDGAVLILVAVGLVGMFLMTGLAIEAGIGYVRKAQLSRAVDAAALAGARSLREGQGKARKRALAVAAANGVSGKGETSVNVTFGSNEWDEKTVTVTGTRVEPTRLMRLAGQEKLTVGSTAVAAVPPVDLVLVLDQSGSLEQAGAWKPLQRAAKQFVGEFDDDIDQLALVSFNLRAGTHFPLSQPFVTKARTVINGMSSLGYTNTGEGLRQAYLQFQSGLEMERSIKVVVFFTDGRPTAYRGMEGPDGEEEDRILAAYSTPNTVMGYWDDPDELPMDQRPPADGCLPNTRECFGYISREDVFANARDLGAYWADRIRSEDIMVYTIGLGDSSQPPGSILQPDQDYLRQLANEGGITNPNQVKGKMYFAPSIAEIQAVFDRVAQDLVARLAG